MAIIDVFILTILAILLPHLKRRMHSTLEQLAILWRHIKCRMHRHGHSSRPATERRRVDLVSHSLAYHRHRR